MSFDARVPRSRRGSIALPSCSLVALLSCAAPEVRTSPPPGAAPAGPAAPERPPAEGAAPLSLEFIDDFNPPRPDPGAPLAAPGAAWDAALGGLSGLHYERSSATLFAVSDLPARFEARFYAFHVALTEAALTVVPKAVSFFREAAPSGLLEQLDAESITGDGHGGFYVGTENGFDRPEQRVPRILRVRGDGLVTGALTLPDAYLPATEPGPRGTRSNLAFEGLSLSPSGRWLTAIVESALYQDGEVPSFERGARVRLLRWDLAAGAAPEEFFYPVEPMPRPATGTPTGGNNGVSELLALDDRRLLVLERAYVPVAEGRGRNTIRLFETWLPEGPAPPGAAPRPLDKRLVIDLDDIVPALEPGYRSLDNVEGMTRGPDLPPGQPSLLLVTDDNFRDEQRTTFLAFRARGLAPIEPPGSPPR